jgi:hypothetical protein
MGGFHAWIHKQGTLEFLDLVEQWSNQQLDQYIPKY